jgi:tetratricopeptide (TPR) repeat protein
MTLNPMPAVEPLDPALIRLVDQLQERVRTRPQERWARMALDGILDQLIQDALASATAADEGQSAIERLEELAMLFPESPTPLLHLSKVCLDQLDYEAAQEYAETGLEVEPLHYGLNFNLALTLLETGNYEPAIAGFKHCLELKPNEPWSHTNIGDAYRLRKRYQQAEKHLQKALELDDHFAPAYFNLALLHMDQEDWAGCVHYGLKALRYDPGNKRHHLVVGEAYLSLKEDEVGLQHLVAATLIDRDYVPAYEAMSAAYVNLAMYELSIAAAIEALKRDPTSWRALANIAFSHKEQGQFDEAIRIYEDALGGVSDPDDRYRLYWELGWDCFLAEQYERALEYTDKAIEMLEHPDLILFFNKGLIFLAQGRMAEADAVYNQAIGQAELAKDKKVIGEARHDLEELLSRKDMQLDEASVAHSLLKGGKKVRG